MSVLTEILQSEHCLNIASDATLGPHAFIFPPVAKSVRNDVLNMQ